MGRYTRLGSCSRVRVCLEQGTGKLAVISTQPLPTSPSDHPSKSPLLATRYYVPEILPRNKQSAARSPHVPRACLLLFPPYDHVLLLIFRRFFDFSFEFWREVKQSNRWQNTYCFGIFCHRVRAAHQFLVTLVTYKI